MLKKTITYEDYNGTTRTEDFWFHLNKAEILKWILTEGDYTLDRVILRLSEERNGKEIMRHFENIIKMSYGRKSLDGKRFEKNERILEEFMETEAYSNLFIELVTDAKAGAEFINGVIPKDLAEEVSKAIAENPDGVPAELRDYTGPALVPSN